MRASAGFIFVALCVNVARQHKVPGTSGFLRLHDHQRISHDTYYLGEHPHPEEKHVQLHGYAFLNLHRSAVGRVSGHVPRPEKAMHFNRTSLATHIYGHCTGPIADGAAWRNVRGFYLHTLNRQGLSPDFLIDALQRANDEWRCALDAYHKTVAGPLIGVVSQTSGAEINLSMPDGRNEIGFATIQGRPGTVAVTIVWGVFGGPLEQRRITEYDMVFDGVHYQWGDGSVNKNVMDVQAIATHETGHSLGLDDVYDGICNTVTMFGTSAEGETKKRTIEPTDIEGLSDLYANKK